MHKLIESMHHPPSPSPSSPKEKKEKKKFEMLVSIGNGANKEPFWWGKRISNKDLKM